MAFEGTIAVALLTYVMFYIAMNMDRNKYSGVVLQILFVGVGMFFVLITLQIVALDAAANALTTVANAAWLGYGIFTYIAVFVIFLMILLVLLEALGITMKFGGQGEEE